MLPRDYSRRLVALTGPAAGPAVPARIEILTNPAAGSFARSAAQSIATRSVMGVTMTIAERLVAASGSAAAPAVMAHRVRDSMRIVAVPAEPIGEKSARGLAPFYFALMLALGGFLGAAIVNIGVEFKAGHLGLDLFARRLHMPRSEITAEGLWWRKLVLVLALALAAVAGVLQTWLAVGVLGMQASEPVTLGLFSVLGVAASALLTLVFLVPFGIAGTLLALLVTTIFGVPSSGGPYPVQMLPDFFRFLAGWLPLRYTTDGARAIVFFDARTDAGLGTALWVLGVYVAGSILVSGLIAFAIARRQRPAGQSPVPAAGLVRPRERPEVRSDAAE